MMCETNILKLGVDFAPRGFSSPPSFSDSGAQIVIFRKNDKPLILHEKLFPAGLRAILGATPWAVMVRGKEFKSSR